MRKGSPPREDAGPLVRQAGSTLGQGWLKVPALPAATLFIPLALGYPFLTEIPR